MLKESCQWHTVLHEIQLNATQHSKQQCFWCPLLPFLNLSFLYLGKRILSFPYYPAVYSLCTWFTAVFLVKSLPRFIFSQSFVTIFYNLMFLQSFLNGSRQNVKKVKSQQNCYRFSFAGYLGKGSDSPLKWVMLPVWWKAEASVQFQVWEESTCIWWNYLPFKLKCLISFKCQVSFLHVGLALVWS